MDIDLDLLSVCLMVLVMEDTEGITARPLFMEGMVIHIGPVALTTLGTIVVSTMDIPQVPM